MDSNIPELSIWDDRPTKHWFRAYPIGNGRIGAMIFGGVKKEHIQFNEETFWTGHEYNNVNPNAYKHLETVRELIFNKEFAKADEIIEKNMLGIPDLNQAYQTFGDLFIKFEDHDDFSNYHRELDINSSIVKVSYLNLKNNVKYSRSYFASHPANIIVMKFASNKPGMLNFSISMKRKFDEKLVTFLFSGF